MAIKDEYNNYQNPDSDYRDIKSPPSNYSAAPTNTIDLADSKKICISNMYHLPELNWKFIPEIPKIMRANNWDVGANFQERWLAKSFIQLKGKARDGVGVNGIGTEIPLEIVPIDIDWVLSFARAKEAYDALLTPPSPVGKGGQIENRYYFAARNALSSLKTILQEQFSSSGSSFIAFGNFTATGKSLDDQFINHISVDYSPRLDGITAALGAFGFYVIAGGDATKLTENKIEVQINKVGIYLRDSFDFNDDQFLGFWAKPDYVSVNGPRWSRRKPGDDPDSLCFEDDSFNITNSTYRNYRMYMRMGADFLVYSKVKVVELLAPVSALL